MRIFHIRPFIAFILILFLLTGCGTSSGQKEEPPVYSPLQVLVPEAPGKKTLGASPLTLDISNADQGYLTAISDSDSQKMNVQLTSENEAVYSYFVSPGKSAVIPFPAEAALIRYVVINRLTAPDMQHYLQILWKSA